MKQMIWVLMAACAAPLFAADTIKESDYEGTIKIACVGDSITFGAGIRDRKNKSYPKQWGAILGEKYEVQNFGRSGATLLKKGDLPYWKQGEYKGALAFKPDVVVIKLGTNDTKPQNWKHKAEFVADYKELIKSFQDLESKPKVWICLPVPVYQTRWGISDSVVKESMPMVIQIGKEAKVPVIDLYVPLSGKAEMFPDKIHPNAAGAAEMVKVIHAAVTGKGDE